MRRILFLGLVLLGLAAPAAAQVQNLCGPAAGGPVCIGTPSGQPIEFWPGLNPRIRLQGVTFLPIADDTITFGDSTHRFKDPSFSGTLTVPTIVATVGISGPFSPSTVTLDNGGAVRGTTTTAQTWLLQAYDNNTGPGYVTFATFTNGNTPSLAFAVPAGGASITYGGTSLTVTGAAQGATVIGTTSITTPIYIASGTGVSVANVGANSCGTDAATIAGNQTSGVVTVGATSGTQCRVTFSTAAPVARDCVVTDSTTTLATRATVVSTSATDFLGAFVAGDKITYVCVVR